MSEAEERKPTLLAKASTFVLIALVAVVAVYGLTHASIRPINPGQKAPKKHFGDVGCSVCH
jgi:hypothetical protein